jgi:hypothetical protein
VETSHDCLLRIELYRQQVDVCVVGTIAVLLTYFDRLQCDLQLMYRLWDAVFKPGLRPSTDDINLPFEHDKAHFEIANGLSKGSAYNHNNSVFEIRWHS